jgi:hypothetical protein
LSSKVRGVASEEVLGYRADLNTSSEEHSFALKLLLIGYAPSEYLTKPWPMEAQIVTMK